MPDLSPEAELQTILEGIGEGFYALDRDWRIRHFNSEAARHFGRPAAEMNGHVIWDLFPGARDTALAQNFRAVMASRQPMIAESPSVIFEGRWLAYRLFPIGDGIGVVFRDISDRKRAEQQRDLLMAELSHRVTNTLALVQAVAAQTLKDIDPGLRRAFEARLVALGAAQNALTAKDWTSADLHDIVGAVAHVPADRLSADGPHVRLNPASAVAFSLAIHELTTNALKYGALSGEHGTVEIRWAVADGRLRFTWTESGGPPVSAPARKGFGSRMIEISLAAQIDGTAQIDYAPTGLHCTIAAPLAALGERESAGPV
jgi:PAS domain S-box-containing protein